MSTIEENGAKGLNPDALIHSNPNEQAARSYNKKRTSQHSNEYESSSHASKRNRMEYSGPVDTMDQHDTVKTSAATTSSYFNAYHQPKKITMIHQLVLVVNHQDNHFHLISSYS